MKSRDRMLIYFKAACITVIVVPLSLPLLYFLFFALSDPIQRAIFCYAAKPVFSFGNIVNARLGDLIILYVFYWILLGMVAVLGTVWLYTRLLHRDERRPGVMALMRRHVATRRVDDDHRAAVQGVADEIVTVGLLSPDGDEGRAWDDVPGVDGEPGGPSEPGRHPVRHSLANRLNSSPRIS